MEDLKFDEPRIDDIDKDLEYFQSLVLKVFYANKDGAKLLELFKDSYFKVPVCVPGQIDGMGYYREGQNSVFRHIDEIIQQKLSVK